MSQNRKGRAPRPIAYPYVVRHLHVVVSDALYALLVDRAAIYGTTLQDYVVFSLARGTAVDGANETEVHILPDSTAAYMPVAREYIENVGVPVPF